MTPPAAAPKVEVERPETPPRVREKLAEGEMFFRALKEKVEAMAESQTEIKTDVRELRQQMREHEKLNAERSMAREESEREMRGEISALRESASQGFREIDGRLDKVEGALKILVDRQPPAEAQTPPGPITTVFGIPPRKQTGSTAAVAGGGVGVAAILGLLTQLATLPVALQWAMAAIAAAAAITACVVVAVRMTRRE